jgi:transposase
MSYLVAHNLSGLYIVGRRQMKRTIWLQETKRMRFKEAYGDWQQDRLTQEEAALILGVSDRTFRRYIDRYEESGLEGIADKRLTQTSSPGG